MTLMGKILDASYARKLASNKDLSLNEIMLLGKLPDVLTEVQKKNKIKNILQALKKDKIIQIDKTSTSREWVLV